MLCLLFNLEKSGPPPRGGIFDGPSQKQAMPVNYSTAIMEWWRGGMMGYELPATS